MDNKDALSRTERDNRLSSNHEYYKYIFKKTEKIVCAVFYTLRSDKDIVREDVLIKNIEQTANKVMMTSFMALRTEESKSEAIVRELGYMLMELESVLKTAHFGRVIGGDVLSVFSTEIDSVLRGLKVYVDRGLQNPFLSEDRTESRKERAVRTRVAGPQTDMISGGVADDQAGKTSRTERIVEVLRDKGQASIKDISEVVTDVSEKTIQRELGVLIKDMRVRKEGERRWSKYSLN